MARNNAWYGWLPDLPDHRDFYYAAPLSVLSQLPPKVDLSGNCPAVYDQGQIGSCTANAIGGAVEFDQMKQTLADVFVPSRLFIYYNERVIEHTVGEDSGAMIRDGIKSVAKQGVCPEKMWPYDPAPFPRNKHLTKKPRANCYTEGRKHTAVQYQRVPRILGQMKGCLAAGFPFVFGFTVYQSFESDQVARSGVVNMPAPSESVVGGHAVMAVGYDNVQNRFRARNSWGTDWGMKGYFTIPFSYLLDQNLSDDFWKITLVSGDAKSRRAKNDA